LGTPNQPESGNSERNFLVAQKIKTAFQKFQALAKGLLAVPRDEVLKKAKQEKKSKKSRGAT
jgi:hypothetical protein